MSPENKAVPGQIKVLIVHQFYEDRFKGKDFNKLPESVSDGGAGVPIAYKKYVDRGDIPGLASCFMLPDENGKCYIYRANWDSSD
jgi:hypothetical protein